MGSPSIVHWLIVISIAGALAFPVSIILRKAGFSPWWALVSLVPLVNWIALWAFALVRWPTEKSSDA
ncbi:MAG: hypothetical protein ACKN9P_02080 [Phenylobacterium sp.]